MERLDSDTVSALIASLKRHGVSDEIINEALSEVTQRWLNCGATTVNFHECWVKTET